MPLPLTLSLSVMAPILYLSVSCRPFKRSTIKKRLSFSMNFGFGTLTRGIMLFPIADFRFPIQPPHVVSPFLAQLNSPLQLAIGNELALARRRSDCGNRRFTLRYIHQPDIPSLALQIEITRAPVDSRQK